MNISVIFTGGTIGSSLGDDGYISPDERRPRMLIDMYTAQYGEKHRFSFSEPYSILSENLSAEYIVRLSDAVKRELDKNPDGIIVTHGTDTLQYTAGILGYIFCRADIPIILVSSNYPLTDKRANGLLNFSRAVDFIDGKYGNGVFVSYSNDLSETFIHRASRVLPHTAYSADVYSVGGYYGRFDKNGYSENRNFFSYGNENLFGDATGLLRYRGKILRISSCPEMTLPQVDENTAAVLYETYHSGTICINDATRRFADECRRRNIPVFLTGAGDCGEEYATAKEYKALGFIALPKASPCAMYCKLWLSLACGKAPEKTMTIPSADDFAYISGATKEGRV